MTLAEFLTARIAEDEAAARAAGDVAAAPWQWEHLPPPLDYGLVGTNPIQGGATVIIPSRSGDMWPDRDTAAHIARWDPARVLAECEAKAMAIRFCDLSDVGWPEKHRLDHCDHCSVLRALAAVYATHPDYDPAWAL